jgi:hypothetical protein
LRQKLFEVAEGLSEAKRKSALGLLVRKWSPYPSTGFMAHWVGRRATVYAWDSAKVESAILEAGLSLNRCVVWPETFLRDPIQNGARLARMTDGYEGQVWRDGLLVATRWWPEAPQSQAWVMFLRSAGADLSQVDLLKPQPVDSTMAAFPWTVAAAPITDVWSLLQNERAAAIAATIVLVPFIYLIAQAGILGIATGHVSGAMSDLSGANQSIRLERSEALANLDTIQRYLSLEPYPSQFELLADARHVLVPANVTITEWLYDSGNIEMSVRGDTPLDATFYIEAFEKDPAFSNVTATTENQGNQLRLHMQANPKARFPS